MQPSFLRQHKCHFAEQNFRSSATSAPEPAFTARAAFTSQRRKTSSLAARGKRPTCWDATHNSSPTSCTVCMRFRAEEGRYAAYISAKSPWCSVDNANVAVKVGYRDWQPEGSGWAIATSGINFCVWGRH